MSKKGARLLKIVGGVLISWGSLGLLGFASRALLSVGKRTGETRMPASNSDRSDARAVIPKAIGAIYASLNDGDPFRAAVYLSPKILNNTSALDSICKPYNLHGLYIETIAERQVDVFQANVHVLFKEGGERVYAMLFQMVGTES